MKETQQLKQKTQEVAKVKEERKQQKVGTFRKPYKNMILFQLNLKTLLVSAVEYAENKAVITESGAVKTEKKLVHNPECLYVWALNMKNAQRKFRNEIERRTHERLQG